MQLEKLQDQKPECHLEWPYVKPTGFTSLLEMWSFPIHACRDRTICPKIREIFLNTGKPTAKIMENLTGRFYRFCLLKPSLDLRPCEGN